MPTVLFVCVENAGRSQMAEGFARVMAQDRGLQLDIWSAGSRPSGRINPVAAEAMAACGINISAQHSKGLDALPQQRWDYLVTMGCGDVCPAVAAHHREDWLLPDPKGQSPEAVSAIRDEIRGRVNALLDRIATARADQPA